MSQTKPTDIEADTYAQDFVLYGDKTKAWGVTFPESKAAPETRWPKASRFHDIDKVRARIRQLNGKAIEIADKFHGITIDTLLTELEENRQAALTAETPQSSAATAATLGKAKLLGMDKDIIDHQSSDGSMSNQWKVEFINATPKD